MINVEMLSTGDEVLHGQIVDTKCRVAGRFLFQSGITVNAPATPWAMTLIPWSRCYVNAVNRRMC
ncbi:CinA-like protein [Raoultella planticola]|uniref:CinA-like protein n=1 Tax=Raoultella planticola TaxID=575 RepID=A0A485C305_RAOPL|nr:CinA-like protein [Raoultella planticola]